MITRSCSVRIVMVCSFFSMVEARHRTPQARTGEALASHHYPGSPTRARERRAELFRIAIVSTHRRRLLARACRKIGPKHDCQANPVGTLARGGQPSNACSAIRRPSPLAPLSYRPGRRSDRRPRTTEIRRGFHNRNVRHGSKEVRMSISLANSVGSFFHDAVGEAVRTQQWRRATRR